MFMRTQTMFPAIIAALLTPAIYAQPAAQFSPPAEIRYRIANIWSAGTRMHAEVFSPASGVQGKLPTILMAHGWGGTVANLRAEAVAFAKAGYLAVAFDYRGWGESDSRLIFTGVAPA